MLTTVGNRKHIIMWAFCGSSLKTTNQWGVLIAITKYQILDVPEPCSEILLKIIWDSKFTFNPFGWAEVPLPNLYRPNITNLFLGGAFNERQRNKWMEEKRRELSVSSEQHVFLTDLKAVFHPSEKQNLSNSADQIGCFTSSLRWSIRWFFLELTVLLELYARSHSS